VVVSDHDDIITISETECRNIRHLHINLPATTTKGKLRQVRLWNFKDGGSYKDFRPRINKLLLRKHLKKIPTRFIENWA
jgi:hypothetical protein